MFKRPAYLVAVVFEQLGFSIASFTLSRLGLAEYLYSADGFIVGLHFIGLWRATGSRSFLAIAAGMCLVSALSMALPFTHHGFELRYAFLGAGNALVLWTGSALRYTV